MKKKKNRVYTRYILSQLENHRASNREDGNDSHRLIFHYTDVK